LEKELPELPDAMKNRISAQYSLSPYDTEVLIQHGAVNFFEKVREYITFSFIKVASKHNPKKAAAW
jgi:Asp-tRNA(Asn)/Glu-tRNA(Gln) amidotransferase B subunit